MSYFDHFLSANEAYVALHGTAHLPLKPKTRVAIVTCMDSRLHVAQALGLAWRCPYFTECGWACDRGYDSVAGYFSAANGNARNCSFASYRLWSANLY